MNTLANQLSSSSVDFSRLHQEYYINYYLTFDWCNKLL
jgi:hypothetical protein